jgi:hypothetical protein
MPELSIELKKLETLRGAFDILRYLSEDDTPTGADDICDDLDMSDRRFGKAIKRLVTRSYVQMNSDYAYFLTQKGIDAAEELAAFDAGGGSKQSTNENKVMRRLLVAMPRQLTAGKTTDLHVGIESANGSSLATPADIVMRVSAVHALLSGNDDEIMKLSDAAMTQTLQLTPEMYTEVRVKIQIFQIAPNGEDINMCGGLYVDVDVNTSDSQDGLIAYASDVAFDPT